MISVITPVFNGAKFLDKTIESVLSQDGVQEHLLIDDGSTDGSWAVITRWAERDRRVVPLHHADKKNHGRSATRNLGLYKASQKYVGFLDADDFYLPGRFNKDLDILESDPSVDGVYNAIGAHYYLDNPSDDLKRRVDLTTVTERISPSVLFYNLSPFGDKGYFSGDGLIVRRTVFDKTGYFNESLRVGEDSDLWKKMALICSLVAGEIDKPVALRGVHDDNIFYDEQSYLFQRVKLYTDMLVWAKEKKAPITAMNVIFNQLLKESLKDVVTQDGRLSLKITHHFRTIMRAFAYVPSLIIRKKSWGSVYRTSREIN